MVKSKVIRNANLCWPDRFKALHRFNWTSKHSNQKMYLSQFRGLQSNNQAITRYFFNNQQMQRLKNCWTTLQMIWGSPRKLLSQWHNPQFSHNNSQNCLVWTPSPICKFKVTWLIKCNGQIPINSRESLCCQSTKTYPKQPNRRFKSCSSQFLKSNSKYLASLQSLLHSIKFLFLLFLSSK